MRSVEDYVAMFAGEDAATIRNAIGAVDGIEPVDEEHDRRLRGDHRGAPPAPRDRRRTGELVLMRNISFSLTTPQFIDGTKDVTRRIGWETAKAGEVLRNAEYALFADLTGSNPAPRWFGHQFRERDFTFEDTCSACGGNGWFICEAEGDR